MPKTKTKTKYLKLTSCGWSLFKDPRRKKAAIVTQVMREQHDGRRQKNRSGARMKLTDQEGIRLVQAMLAMRPDWTANKPGILLRETNTTGGLPHAQDFGHAIRALAHYATETGPDGRPAKRTPNLYPADGQHWTSTATNPAVLPQGPPCEDHAEEPARNCRCCWADVKTGHRPTTHIGKHHTPESETTT